ncbi:PREDICTED: uncharacterized protein LOC107333964 [Acropora digitifera]|uniref:uncharacterized protein LOC107333964 n=1 Tax=Acropora digitifera TaxID=70779 RepID=UPI00077A4275|nr:PREDICTED: uncharacterized protein LOC107333964 [Acropora digitifera]
MTVTEPKARRTILRRDGKCFVCLKGGHISTNCQSRAKCFNCEGRLHVTICERIWNTLTSRNVVGEEASPRGSGSCQDGSRDAGTSAMHISNNANSVLLRIAQAFVCRPDNAQLGLNAHVIFDCCSQRSYITSQAREKLNVPTNGKETLLIKTFGDNSASVKECDVVQLCVRTLDGMNVSLEQDEAFSDDFEKSNRPKVAEEDESFSKSVFKHSSEKEQRVLGMLWNPTQDELIYDLNKTLGEVDAQPVTKRLILSTATRFFDPLGLIAPVILPLKMMFQKLCKDGKDWDELVDAELNHQWLTTLSDLRQTGRIVESVSQALHDDVRIDEVFNWTDSMISLWWITNTDKEYKQFVENRMAEIRGNSPPEQLRYCPTADNPANIASRGIRSIEMKESSLWLHGPDFLSKSGEQWPAQPTVVQAKEEFSELKSSKPAVYSLVTACVEEKREEPSLDNLINPENFSSLTKLMKLTVLVLSFY